MRIDAAEGSDFLEDRDGILRQMVAVRIVEAPPGGTVVVTLTDAATAERSEATAVVADTGEARVAVAVGQPTGARGGRTLAATAHTEGDAADAEFVVRYGVPGWSLHLVPHFHYDPVWWNTQGSFVSDWETMPGSVASRGMESQVNAFELMRLYLDKAAAEPSFRFVVSEIDYLKPWWSSFPHRRQELLELIREGRVEVLGG